MTLESKTPGSIHQLSPRSYPHEILCSLKGLNQDIALGTCNFLPIEATVGCEALLPLASRDRTPVLIRIPQSIIGGI